MVCTMPQAKLYSNCLSYLEHHRLANFPGKRMPRSERFWYRAFIALCTALLVVDLTFLCSFLTVNVYMMTSKLSA